MSLKNCLLQALTKMLQAKIEAFHKEVFLLFVHLKRLRQQTLRAMNVEPGQRIRIETRRGAIDIMARADRAVAEDMVFVPFAFVEAPANMLTNPQLDPYGKIPEFKFSACRVSKLEAGDLEAAE